MTLAAAEGGRPRSLAWVAAENWFKVMLATIGVATAWLVTHGAGSLTDVFALTQDLPLAAVWAGVFALMLAPFVRLGPGAAAAYDRTCERSGARIALGLAAFAAAAAFAGWFTVYHRYPLSLDEFWASFDARIFDRGRLLAPVSPPWRPYAPAMQPMWRLQVPGSAAWASTYLPMNAAAQALFARLGSAALAGAAWTAAAVALVYALAREIWPDRRDGAVVAAVLMAGSAQVVVAGMTPYAMPGHLALNLAWLWLFRRPGAAAQALAILVAFVATGLHQFIFHPLFAWPFVVQLWWRRRWAAAALHTAAYAVIVPFWMAWWPLVFTLAGYGAGAAGAAAHGATAQALALAFQPIGPFLMAENLLRLTLWQHPLTVPLALVGAAGWWKDRDGPVAPMAAGLIFAVVFLTLITPYQGHGWGYRYLHGFLGSLCLLAAGAWIRLTEADEARARAWAALGAATLATLLVLLPLRLWQVSRFIDPYARAEAAIVAAKADVVVVDADGIRFGDDLVRNDPFLTNRPKVMHRLLLSAAQMRALCASRTVALFDRRDAAILHMPVNTAHTGVAFASGLSEPAEECGAHVLAR